MTKTNNKFIAGICAIALAIVLFLISGIDSIELIGKYRVTELNGEEISEYWEYFDLEEDAAKIYMSFGFFGKLDMDFSINSKLAKISEEEVLELSENFKEEIEEEMTDMKWSMDDGKLVIDDDGNETKERCEIKFNTVSIGKKSYATVLKRAGVLGYICPSMIMRAFALVLLLIGVLLLIPKNTSDGAAYSASASCPSCGGITRPGEKFCQNCGTALDKSIPMSEDTMEHCTNCGSLLKPGFKFCDSCGTRVNAGDIQIEPISVSTSDSASTPVSDSPENSGGLKSTFKKSVSVEEPVGIKPSETDTENTNHFQTAGDL